MKPATITGASALDAVCFVQEIRVSRCCPKCLVRAQQRGNADGVNHRIVCIRCGHVWFGKITFAERRR